VSSDHEVFAADQAGRRGDTTVVDAYLSPILRRYVATVDSELDAKKSGARLMFMMSSGGLTAAELFQGKDAILSGPAGGVVGMAETGREAGFKNLIGFDMGGTSTDVSHYDGDYERAFETEVAGVRMRAPMMLIHTVAAGRRLGAAFRRRPLPRRPDSRGANPGPEMLPPRRPARRHRRQRAGRQAHPDFFPKIFRPGAEPAARRRGREKIIRRAGQRGRREISRRDRRRLHQDRGREHGQRDQEDFGAARL
jgi:5-oxoprolinase (ATP-hydrolysing)